MKPLKQPTKFFVYNWRTAAVYEFNRFCDADVFFMSVIPGQHVGYLYGPEWGMCQAKSWSDVMNSMSDEFRQMFER